MVAALLAMLHSGMSLSSTASSAHACSISSRSTASSSSQFLLLQCHFYLAPSLRACTNIPSTTLDVS
eukprot:6844455-Alexandrium_andersonii.AAC.1